MQYRIERLSQDLIKDLENLHEAVYSKKPVKAYYQKKYDTAYTCIEYVGFIAYDTSGTPIAYYGVIPCFIGWKNEKILAAQSADTMTHPLYRNKGLFKDLSIKTLDLCRELKIELVFGFPNENSYPGFMKFGWQTIHTMEFYAIRVQTFPLYKLSKKIGFLQIPYERWRKQVLEKYYTETSVVENSVIKDGFAGILRDEAYKKYKSYNKTRVIQSANATVWVKPGEALLIGDMEYVTKENFNHVIDNLKSVAKKLGLTQIQFHCSKGTTLNKLFSAIINPAPSFHVIIKDLGSDIPLDQLKFTLADIDIF